MILSFNHVYKSYQQDKYVLNNIHLQIKKGDFVFLTGPSGAGKTTFLRHIYMNEIPDKGDVVIYLNKYNIYRSNNITPKHIQELRRNIGIVFQDFKLFYDRSVFNNIALPLQLKGENTKVIKNKVYEYLSIYGLSHKALRNPKELSGGEKQRVAIARAMINDPYLIIADEPTGNLDINNSWDIIEIFKKAHSQGTTVIMATHQIDIVKKLPYTCLKINNGTFENRFI